MDRLLRLGHPIFGVSIVAFGILSLIYRTGVKGLEPIPTAWPGQVVLGIASGIVLVGLGACLVTGWQARRAAGLLALTMGIWLAALHLPLIVGNASDPNVVTIVAETLALFGAAGVLWSSLRSSNPATSGQLTGKLSLIGRICFVLTLIVFGILHFIYHAFVGSLVPSWIPAGVFWAYFTGAFIAAGVGIGLRIQARLAAAARTDARSLGGGAAHPARGREYGEPERVDQSLHRAGHVWRLVADRRKPCRRASCSCSNPGVGNESPNYGCALTRPILPNQGSHATFAGLLRAP